MTSLPPADYAMSIRSGETAPMNGRRLVNARSAPPSRPRHHSSASAETAVMPGRQGKARHQAAAVAASPGTRTLTDSQPGHLASEGHRGSDGTQRGDAIRILFDR